MSGVAFIIKQMHARWGGPYPVYPAVLKKRSRKDWRVIGPCSQLTFNGRTYYVEHKFKWKPDFKVEIPENLFASFLKTKSWNDSQVKIRLSSLEENKYLPIKIRRQWYFVGKDSTVSAGYRCLKAVPYSPYPSGARGKVKKLFEPTSKKPYALKIEKVKKSDKITLKMVRQGQQTAVKLYRLLGYQGVEYGEIDRGDWIKLYLKMPNFGKLNLREEFNQHNPVANGKATESTEAKSTDASHAGGFYNLPLAKRFVLFQSLVKDIQKIHQAGYILRDIKPENILYDGKQLRLVDLDAACLATDSVEVQGTSVYMSPVISKEDISRLHDYWALNKVLVTCCLECFDVKPILDPRIAANNERTSIFARGGYFSKEASPKSSVGESKPISLKKAPSVVTVLGQVSLKESSDIAKDEVPVTAKIHRAFKILDAAGCPSLEKRFSETLERAAKKYKQANSGLASCFGLFAGHTANGYYKVLKLVELCKAKNIKLDDQLQYMQQFCNGTLGEFSSQAGILQDSFISFLMNELGRDTFLRQAVFDKNKSQLSESHSNWLAKSKVDYRSIGSLYARNRAVCFFEKIKPCCWRSNS